MQIGKICKRKVVCCGLDATALEAAQTMRTEHVGDIVVIDDRDGRRRPVGIVTDRDLIVQVVAKAVDPTSVCASEVMGPELIVAEEHEDIYETVQRMRWKGVRRVPVVNAQGDLIGIASVDDLAEVLSEALADVARISSRQRTVEERKHP
jgi:CBS domain-containing protein